MTLPEVRELGVRGVLPKEEVSGNSSSGNYNSRTDDRYKDWNQARVLRPSFRSYSCARNNSVRSDSYSSIRSDSSYDFQEDHSNYRRVA